ncbi:leucine-rich repeat protein [Treponema vincentii]|uniref:leucine-rich repeat protein n=1 Tax=Treponema vincentii TaxID=69710 RepID=UPI0020A313BD|nr:leucine-rich repeat protein [Treponema vincentii]UTC46514.1 leucine-rich repeat protein [Treponema vincentii]
MKFLKQASLLRLCVAIGMMMIGIAGCRPKVAPAAVYYTITLKVSGAEGGTLKAMINHKPVETGSETNIPVLSGTKISLTAHPREGYKIEGWTGVTAGNTAAELTAAKDSTVSVIFVKKDYTVIFGVKDDTGGTLTATANGNPLTSGKKVPYGTIVTFTAVPENTENYTVGSWTGISAGAGAATTEMLITRDSEVSVEFIKKPANGGSTHPSTPSQPQTPNPSEQTQECTLTFNVKNNIGGTLTATAGSKTLTSNEKVKAGTKVRFTANPKSADGYTIGAWTGIDAAAGTGAVELIITQDVAVTVAFVKNPPPPVQEYTVKFSIAEHAEGGTLTATANGKTLTNNEKVKAGTKVRFTATPKTADGYAIGAWTGIDAAAGTGAVELIITQDVAVTVAFVKITRYGTITFGESEGGSISATVKIGENTEELQSGGKAPYGSIVTFTAIPEDGYVFDRWEGLTDAPSEETATYTVTGDRYVKACFKNAALPYLAVNFEREAWTVSFLGDDSRKKELKGKVIIPEWINGMHITRIGKFENCTEITEVVLPESITSIISFSGCQKLTKIAFPQSIQEIGSFAGCTSLTTIELPQSVERIVNFSNCENLQTINIPHNKKLHYCPSFRMCKKLKKLYLPENIISITEYAFMECTSLELYLPKSIKSIGQCAFGNSASSEDSSVKTVYLPQSLSYEEKQEIRRLIRGGGPKSFGEYDDTQPIP